MLYYREMASDKQQFLFTKFVQVGRVVQILQGAHKDKLAVIIEIIDQTRVCCANLLHIIYLQTAFVFVTRVMNYLFRR